MQNFSVTHRIFLLYLVLLLSGCSGGNNSNNPDVQVNELTNNTTSYDETVHINNCGGKADSEQIKSRSFSTEIQGGIEVGIQQVVQGIISAKYSQSRNVFVSQRLVAPAGTNMEFILRWSEEVHAGNVTVNGLTGTYTAKIPIAVEQISSRDLGCDGQAPVITPQNPPDTPVLENSQLIINGAAYSLPNTTNPYCVAQEVNTGMDVVKSYDISVPDGWVMMWDSWKAEWPGGSYNENGLLIILGPWQGTLTIDTGGSCSGPIQWYDFILDNRRKNYPVPSRLEYTLGGN